MPLTLHRLHVAACPHRPKGWNYTLCQCPIWCDGIVRGQRVKRALATTDWDRALDRAALLESGAVEVPTTAPGRVLSTAAEAFLSDCAARNLKPASLATYRRTFAALQRGIGDVALGSITVDGLDRWRAGRRVGDRPLAPRSARKELEHVRTFLTWCEARNWITGNPAKRLRQPQATDVPTLPYTREEVAKLLDATDRMRAMHGEDLSYIRRRTRALVLVLLYSGLRISDVAALRRDALGQSNHLTLRTTKTGAPVRVLLHADAAAALRGLPAPGGNPAHFFWSGRGQHCAKSLGRTLTRLGRLVEVHCHAHRFRDTFAVELLTNGADIRTVQLLLGHDSVRTTEKHYAPFVLEHQRRLDEAAATLSFGAVSGPMLVVRGR